MRFPAFNAKAAHLTTAARLKQPYLLQMPIALRWYQKVNLLLPPSEYVTG